MKKLDLRSLLIGVLGATLMFVLLGADKPEIYEGNLGDIIVNSITIRDDGHGGFITAYNQDQKRTLYLGTGGKPGAFAKYCGLVCEGEGLAEPPGPKGPEACRWDQSWW